MKKLLFIALAALTAGGCAAAQDQRSMTMFDHVVFYDGYQDKVIDADLDDGILRHRNSLYAKQLTDEQLDWAALEMTLNITIGALCDNYDRIGNINIALVPKGETTYNPFEVDRLELGRFITPFMNKNKQPNEVPYTFELNHLGHIFHDMTLREKYDFWLEFELFGVPYAANQQILGCIDRNDVFEGTLEFVTSGETLANNTNDVLVPIVMKKPEYIASNLNNYNEAGTDTIGTCTKTYVFEVPEDVEDSHIVFIISNHGANSGGEEYIRRLHLIYFDGELALTYTPGGVSCEPYRKYNTQSNGIYSNRRTDSFWKNNSNWCPGAVIPVRYLNLGAMSKGKHKVMVRVPDAKFASQQGDFPVSMYFQGLKSGTFAGIEDYLADEPATELRRHGDTIRLVTDKLIREVRLLTFAGQEVYSTTTDTSRVSLKGLPEGAYIVCLFHDDGVLESFKITK